MLGGRKRGHASVGAAVEEGQAPKRWSSPRSGSRAVRVVAASASVAVASYGDEDDDEADDNDNDDMRGVDVDDDIEGLLGLSAEQLAKVEEREGLTAEASKLDWQGRIDLIKKSRSAAQQLGKPRAIRRPSIGGKWSPDEDASLRGIVEQHGAKNWKRIASLLGPTRTDVQCLHRWNKVLRPGLHKGSWSDAEDAIVREMVAQNVGAVKWSTIAAKLPGRIGKQCRERWFNHLDPTIKRGDWDPDEDRTLFEAQRNFGNRWCEISKILPGRTENAVKNRWNSSTMKKWLKENSLEPGSGHPICDLSMPGGLDQAIKSFKSSLDAAGVKGAESIAALMAPDPNDDDDFDGRGRSSKKGGGSKKSSRGSARGGRSSSRGVYAASSSGSAGGGGSAYGTRPASKISSRRRGDDSQMANLLGNLKSSPTSQDGRVRSGAGRTRSRRDPHSAFDEDGIDDVDEDGMANGEMDLSEDELGDVPISQALRRLHNSLQYSGDGDLEQVPLTMLPFFAKFNAGGQKSLLRQLIEKFQRTNTTPRNAMLPTPNMGPGTSTSAAGGRFDLDALPIDSDPIAIGMGMGILHAGLDSPRFSALGSETHDWEQLGDESVFPAGIWGMSPTAAAFPSSSRSKRSSARPLSVRSAAPISVFAEGETSPVDLAILVAFNVASRSKNAASIMKMVLGESASSDAPNRPASTTHSAMLPPVGTLTRKNSHNKDSVGGTTVAGPSANTVATAGAGAGLEAGIEAGVGAGSGAGDNGGPAPIKASVMSRMPAHLRPPLINTERRRGDGTTAEKLTDLLSGLKSDTPSPLLPGGQLKTKSPSAASVDSGRVSGGSDLETGAVGDMDVNSSRVTRSMGRRDCKNVNADGPNSIVSQALRHLTKSLLLKREEAASAEDHQQPLPLTMLPFFNRLNTRGKRNLIEQLIEKFQRTNTTPRNAILPTPLGGPGSARFDADLMTLEPDIIGIFQSALAPDTPRSLAGDAVDWDPINLEENNGAFLWGGGGEQSPRQAKPFASTMGTRKTAIATRAAPGKHTGQLAHLHQQGSGNSVNAFSESGEETTPTDMAIFVAYHCASRSKNSEQIMRMLMSDTGTMSSKAATHHPALSLSSADGGVKTGRLQISTDL